MEEPTRSDPTLEAILPQYAEINHILFSLLKQGKLPDLWAGIETIVKRVRNYFSGSTIVTVPREGYEEQQNIPKATSQAVDDAIKMGVKLNAVWLTSGPATFLGEELPEGILTDDAILRPPPEPIPPTEILPENLPEAWTSGKATALTVSVALSKKQNLNLPWSVVQGTITSARTARYIEITQGQWPCDYPQAKDALIELPKGDKQVPLPFFPPSSNRYYAEAELSPSKIQDLSEKIGEIQAMMAGLDLKLHLRIELQKDPSKQENLEQLNKTLKEIDEKLQLK